MKAPPERLTPLPPLNLRWRGTAASVRGGPSSLPLSWDMPVLGEGAGGVIVMGNGVYLRRESK